MEPNKSSQTQDGAEPNSLNAILEEETKQAEVNPTKLQEAMQKTDGSTQSQNPYHDQQVKPGQIVGYGIPTDQKVEIPIAKGHPGLSKKTKKILLILACTLIVLGILGAGSFMYYDKFLKDSNTSSVD